MPIYQLHREQRLKASMDQIWDFISSPANLKTITPPYMGFDITIQPADKMYSGMIISYKVSPILRLKLTWVTEITHVSEGVYFVDEQRMGPYKMWHHEHHLELIEGGVKMTDLITYQPPFGFLGAIANRLFIKKQLAEIFDFRREVLAKRFGEVE
jgi:ligand-binding SRPBCC domain-containing protein